MTGSLQKGLIVFHDGRPLCEEGMGFGVPALVRGNRTYLSLTATTEELYDSGSARKTFFLDALQNLNFRDREIKNRLVYSGIELSGRAYKKSRSIQRYLRQWGRVRSRAAFEYGFKKIQPQTKIVVDYHVSSDCVDVSVNLSDFYKAGLDAKIFLLNEAGAGFFPRYADANGQVLERQEIGAWERIEAERAWFEGLKNRVKFCIQQQPGTALFRGWEQSDSLSWAGFIFDLSQFEEPVFTYPIMFI